MAEITDLNTYLVNWAGDDSSRHDIATTVRILADAGREISAIIARGPLEGAMGAVVGDNADGDAQKALDIRANDLIIDKLKDAPVGVVGSEELDAAVVLKEGAPLCVTTDPLDGSSNIDTNVSVGTIFSILPVLDAGADATLLQPGTHQLAAGYIIYGPQTALVLTLGEGTDMFTLDRDAGAFIQTQTGLEVSAQTKEFAINASNQSVWFEPISAYINDCMRGEKGPRGKTFNMRWIASLIAECHRIFSRGGIFLYPGDTRKGYRHGRLRLVYEANPVSFLVEQAGGRASTGQSRIMELIPEEVHQRVPFVFGSAEEVKCVENYCSGPMSRKRVSPLFNNRGLFRT